MCKFYKVNDVALMLGVKYDTVLEWIREGKLKNVELVLRDDKHYEYRIPVEAMDDIEVTSAKQIQILEKKLLEAEIKERLARLELLEYQMYQDTCFIEEFKDHIKEMEL